RVPPAGPGRHRAEPHATAPALYAQPGELAAHVAFAGSPPPSEGTLPPAGPAAPRADVVIPLSVLKDQLKSAQPRISAAAGQLVELVFANTDVMPHNFVLGAPG